MASFAAEDRGGINEWLCLQLREESHVKYESFPA